MRTKYLLAATLLALSGMVGAQRPGIPYPIPTPEQSGEIPLYAGAAPGSEKATQQVVWDQIGPQRWERNITHPSIIPLLPPADKANGTAVILVPGGGFLFLSMDNEGYNVARKMNAQGISVFILQYRTLPTPADNDGYMATLKRVFDQSTPKSERLDVNKGLPFAIADAQTAIRYVRAHATDYHLNPHHIGMVGFSAGAMTTFGTMMADAP
ncbi:MAG: alpha/beta hydrolase, partial [Alphaproteobacteria bacterium]|nr:alpha/beta hydrolase [Alphaproteobacteria bacterium]